MKKPSAKKKITQKLWAGRFSEATDPLVEVFTASLPYDYRLLPYDLTGSLAHLNMLSGQRIIPAREAKRIRGGLLEIQKESAQGKPTFPIEDEDVHMFVEKRLTKKIGAVAGKLHTARSRNDQVALDLRLYLRDQIRDLGGNSNLCKKPCWQQPKIRAIWSSPAIPIRSEPNR